MWWYASQNDLRTGWFILRQSVLAKHVPNLFARNERCNLCYFDTEFGTMVQILVGATITASIGTVWAGVINPPRHNEVKVWTYEGEVRLN